MTVDSYVPVKSVRGSSKKRWFRTYQSLRAKVSAWNKAKESGTVKDWDDYRTQRNLHNHAVRACKRQFASDVAISIDSWSGKPWWRAWMKYSVVISGIL